MISAQSTILTSIVYCLLFVIGEGIMPLNTKGFKDVATHDFMFKSARADADSLPISMKLVVLMSRYVRV